MADDESTLSQADIDSVIQRAEQMGTNALVQQDYVNADKIFRELVDISPDNVTGLHGLGILRLIDNDSPGAERFLKRALTAAPGNHAVHLELGRMYLNENRSRKARRSLQRAHDLEPGDPETAYLLASAHIASGDQAGWHKALQSVLAADPKHPAANNDLGVFEISQGNVEVAEKLFRAALESPTSDSSIWVNLGTLYLVTERLKDALDAFKTALDKEPNSADALIGAASVLRRMGRLEDALSDAEKALAMHPDNANAANVAGTIYRELGDFDKARTGFERALQIDPDLATARSNLSLLELLKGDWKSGFENFEARLQVSDYVAQWGRVDVPIWDGSPLDGKGLIVFSEQGFGDSIQFARFVPKLADMGADVTFAVQPELNRLMRELDPRITVPSPEEGASGVSVQINLMSLPRALGITSPDAIDGSAYLSAPKMSDAVQSCLDGMQGLKVGIVWKGAKSHKEDFKRSIAADAIRPIIETPGASFVSIDIGSDSSDLGDVVLSAAPIISDFADTAALVAGLDLVISVDTASVHLAGALGVPCWALIPYVPDWRWLLGRDDCVWYDSVRLYRQPTRGDWAPVIDKVTADLKAKAAH